MLMKEDYFMRRACALFLLVLVSTSALAHDSDNQVREKLKTATVTIEMVGATMSDMLARVGEQVKIKIVFDESIPQNIRDMNGAIKAENKLAEVVLKAILDPAKLDFTVKNGEVLIVKK